MDRDRFSRIVVSFLFLLGAKLFAAEIRVVGSDLLGPGFKAAVAEFSRANESPVVLDLRGTRPGLDALRAGRADIGLFIFPPGESPPGDPFRPRPIGYQTVVVLVPVAVPVTQITVDQLRGVFAKAVAIPLERWGDLGVTGDARVRAIALHAIAPGSSLALPLFRRVVLQDSDFKATIEYGDTVDVLLARIRNADNAMGLVAALPKTPPGLRVLSVAINSSEAAFAPTPETLHAGDYPFRLPLYLVFQPAETPRLLRFLKFLVSEECASRLRAAHFVPLPIATREQAALEFELLR